MSLDSHKIKSADISTFGVVNAPDRLTGTAQQNKMIFDRLIREAVTGLFNGLIDELSGEGGAAAVGATEIEGVTGGDVQTVLGSLKTILDTKSATADMTAALSLKSDKSVTDLHIKNVSLNAETGVFTFTREDGSFVTVDTVLEKVATNWSYDADTQSLVLTLADGTTQRVPLSAFITETEFDDSASIVFSVQDHRVTATIKEGSITDAMLSSALAAQLQGLVTEAADSATNAAQSETAAEQYRTEAAHSAAAARESEEQAARSAEIASTAAANAADRAVAEAEDRLEEYISTATDSRDRAKASETKAREYEVSARESMTSAVRSAEAALRSQTAIEDMTVSSETLAPGMNVRVEKSMVGEHVNLHYGIPRGDVGPQGEQGPQGAQGVQGPPGERGINGVAVAANGQYAFNVNEDGHLILSYTGEETPDFSIGENGHLILNL